jgi:ankyrin repeat protein
MSCKRVVVGIAYVELDAGAKIETGDEDRETALMHAATKNKLNAVKQLIKSGAQVNALNPKYVLYLYL